MTSPNFTIQVGSSFLSRKRLAASISSPWNKLFITVGEHRKVDADPEADPYSLIVYPIGRFRCEIYATENAQVDSFPFDRASRPASKGNHIGRQGIGNMGVGHIGIVQGYQGSAHKS